MRPFRRRPADVGRRSGCGRMKPTTSVHIGSTDPVGSRQLVGRSTPTIANAPENGFALSFSRRLGAAPANAHPEVLSHVDEVTESNDDDGVARAIERLLAVGVPN